MDELTPEQEQAVAATVGAIQRIAMAVVELPQEQRERHYARVRRNFEAAITHFGIEGATAHAWLNSTMMGIRVGIMLAAVAGQMIAGRRAPVFPRFITDRELPTKYLVRLGARAIPVLRYLERAVHPRWPTAFEAARRFVGIVVLLLTAALLLTPIPFSNVAPAVLIVLISLAYIEEDGLLLCLAFFAALILISIALGAVWGAIFSASLISDI